MRIVLFVMLVLGLGGCATAPPNQPDNLCRIFQEKSGWYKAANKSEQRWGAPIPLQMAIIYHESAFVANARPPRGRLLWIIPWKRPSSAYGYTPALDSTWDMYVREAGSRWASRRDFADATDFVGWYIDKSAAMLGIAKTDAYSQYLAYHEGQGGYRRGSYRGKPRVRNTARRVAARSAKYGRQLQTCRAELEAGSGWWPF